MEAEQLHRFINFINFINFIKKIAEYPILLGMALEDIEKGANPELVVVQYATWAYIRDRKARKQRISKEETSPC